MSVTDRQVRRLFVAMDTGAGVGLAAAKAGMHRNTAARHRSRGLLPSDGSGPRTYRTREDVFAADWPGIVEKLRESPGFEAKTLFADLRERRPGVYRDGHLRTLQRRVKSWRATHGPEKDLFFPQEHRPGEAAQTDFTWATELGITICGEPYAHMLCHFVTPFSNFSWATPCQSESIAALFEGVQAGLWEFGGCPHWSQTDHSTAATHEVGSGKRKFNEDYLRLVAHYGMKARATGVGEKEQNGDVEALNGALKRDLEQRLLLRGGRDFESHLAYRDWLALELRRRNASREPRLALEREALGPLPATALPSYTELTVRVGQGSTLSVRGHPYSVPSRLRGERVTVRVHESRVEVLHGSTVELDVERIRGVGGHAIQYRHVIAGMLRKTGAFRCYRYRDAMFPTQTFRRAYERLVADESEWAADGEYLRIVHLAATTMECEVDAALAGLLAAGTRPTLDRVRALVAPAAEPTPFLEAPTVDLASYDSLIEPLVEDVA